MSQTKPDGQLTDKSTSNKTAERRVEGLLAHYELGRKILKACPDGATHDSATIRKFADERGFGLDMIRKAREFARLYTEDEFQVFCGLRTPKGMPLTFSHVRYLLAVKEKSKRSELQTKAAELGWSVDALMAAIQRLQGPRSQGGRPLATPRSPAAALEQITTHTEDWLRRYEKAWGLGESPLFAHVEVSGAEERESVRTSLKRTRKALRQLSEAALALEHRLGKIQVNDQAKSQATATPKTVSQPAAPKSNRRPGKRTR